MYNTFVCMYVCCILCDDKNFIDISSTPLNNLSFTCKIKRWFIDFLKKSFLNFVCDRCYGENILNCTPWL